MITKTWEDKESPESGSTVHDHRVHFEQGQIHNCPCLVAFIKKNLDEWYWNTETWHIKYNAAGKISIREMV